MSKGKANDELVKWFLKHNKTIEPEYLFGIMDSLKILYLIRLHKIKIETRSKK